MSRYNAPFDETWDTDITIPSPFEETWDIDITHNQGFPYTFSFQFDREESRAITEPTETWDSDVTKTGRYGEVGE